MGPPHGTPYVPTEGIQRVLREVGAPNYPPKHPLFCGTPRGTPMGPPMGSLHGTPHRSPYGIPHRTPYGTPP